MTKTELRQRLDALPPRPWRIDEITKAEVGGTGKTVTVGALRASDNRNVIEPSPESSSTIVAFSDVLEFLRDAPDIIEALIGDKQSQ